MSLFLFSCLLGLHPSPPPPLPPPLVCFLWTNSFRVQRTVLPFFWIRRERHVKHEKYQKMSSIINSINNNNMDNSIDEKSRCSSSPCPPYHHHISLTCSIIRNVLGVSCQVKVINICLLRGSGWGGEGGHAPPLLPPFPSGILGVCLIVCFI